MREIIRKIISFIFGCSLLICIVGHFYLAWAFAYAFTYGKEILPFDMNLAAIITEKSFIILFITFIILKFIENKY